MQVGYFQVSLGMGPLKENSSTLNYTVTFEQRTPFLSLLVE